jgi:hypothetical protein
MRYAGDFLLGLTQAEHRVLAVQVLLVCGLKEVAHQSGRRTDS